MKILVTGASGFIGSHLIKALINLYDKESIFAFTSRQIEGVNCILYRDVDSFELIDFDFSGFTHLIHAGAFTPKDAGEANEIRKCESNIFFTNNLLCLDFKNITKIINISTLDVYEDVGVVSETTNIKPASLYGASKYYCEQIVKYFCMGKGIKYLNLRVGHVYGPGEEKYKKLLPIAISKILANETVEIWGDGSELRSLIFIDDVISSIMNALDSEIDNIDVNIVSGSPNSVKDIIDKVIEVSGKNVCVEHINSNHTKRNLVFDNTRLMATLLEKETCLNVGLKEEYRYMKYRYENNI